MLHQVRFECNNRSVHVMYVIDSGECVFSAVTKNPSSINVAEDIIQAICMKEHCDPTSLRFFDLQTHQGYSSKSPGEFEFDQLSVECHGDKVSIQGWTQLPCPATIQNIFSRCISG